MSGGLLACVSRVLGTLLKAHTPIFINRSDQDHGETRKRKTGIDMLTLTLIIVPIGIAALVRFATHIDPVTGHFRED